MKKPASMLSGKPLFVLSLALASLTMGCGSQTKQSVVYRPPAPPADLSSPCQDLPLIADGQAVTVAAWVVDTAGAYKDCQAKHTGLLRAWPGMNFNDALKRKFFGE